MAKQKTTAPKTITEAKARIQLDKERKWAEVSKKIPVFYNPQMKLNRDISVLLLNSVGQKNMQICDLLAGSGIRSLRFLLELKKGKIKSITINDNDIISFKAIKKNIELNKIKNKISANAAKRSTRKSEGKLLWPRRTRTKTEETTERSIGADANKSIIITNKDANILLLESSGFDYIDIDPFGTPNPFLDSAVKRLARNSILAVTATDTSALCGTYENACKRKYWAKPLRNELMHEIGARILIRKTQLIGAHHKKALLPIFTHSSNHYIRIYLKCEKGKKKVDEVLKQHKFFHDKVNNIKDIGPMWFGRLWDASLAKKMLNQSKKSEIYREAVLLLTKISREAEIDTIGFYNIHKLCKKMKIHTPKTEIIIKQIKQKGHKAEETHFAGNSIRSGIGFEELKEILRI